MNIAAQPSKKITVFFGSPHKNGFTSVLLDDFLAKLDIKSEIDFIDAFAIPIKPCIDCKQCKDGACVFNGDGMDKILQSVDSSEIIIVATPIYYDNLPSPLKAIVDRFEQRFISPKATKQKLGIILTTSGSLIDNPSYLAEKTIRLWFRTINTTLISHIMFNNTDNNTIFEIPTEEIEKITHRIKGGTENGTGKS